MYTIFIPIAEFASHLQSIKNFTWNPEERSPATPTTATHVSCTSSTKVNQDGPKETQKWQQWAACRG